MLGLSKLPFPIYITILVMILGLCVYCVIQCYKTNKRYALPMTYAFVIGAIIFIVLRCLQQWDKDVSDTFLSYGIWIDIAFMLTTVVIVELRACRKGYYSESQKKNIYLGVGLIAFSAVGIGIICLLVFA